MTDETPRKIFYLYKITNLVNKKIYIGQTVNPRSRWYQHKNDASKEKPNQVITQAIKKYGNDNFEFEVIASCNNQDDANETEIQLIKQYKSHVSFGTGYNVEIGGNNSPQTDEIKNKRSIAMKNKVATGWMPSTIFIKGGDKAKVWKGKKLSEEHKQHISEGNIGRIFSEETKSKISEAQIGKIISEEQRKKISEINKGQHRSPETEFIKGMVPWNKGKIGVINSWNKGQTTPQEVKDKISASLSKYLTSVQLDEISKLLSEGKSLRKIEEITGINRKFISKELRRLGIKKH